jgi:hypothetical protein
MVKKAVFLTMGEGGRTIRSRVTDWLCGRCAASDVDWNREFSRGQFAPSALVITQGEFNPTVKESEALHGG